MTDITSEETKTTDYHDLLELVDDVKQNMTSEEYKNIVEKIAEIKKKDDKDIYEITFTFPVVERHCYDCEQEEKIRCDCDVVKGERPHITVGLFRPTSILMRFNEEEIKKFKNNLDGKMYGTVSISADCMPPSCLDVINSMVRGVAERLMTSNPSLPVINIDDIMILNLKKV